MELIGNNPAEVALGATYSDMGARATGPEGQDLTVHAYVNNEEVESVDIDTLIDATHEIVYRAVFEDAIGEIVRTVIVGNGEEAGEGDDEIIEDSGFDEEETNEVGETQTNDEEVEDSSFDTEETDTEVTETESSGDGSESDDEQAEETDISDTPLEEEVGVDTEGESEGEPIVEDGVTEKESVEQ